MLIFADFRENIVNKFAIIGSYIHNRYDQFCYFSKDFIGLHGLISLKVPKLPKKTVKIAKNSKNMLIFAYFQQKKAGELNVINWYTFILASLKFIGFHKSNSQ